MLGKILRFLYFNIGFKLRYIFWKCILFFNGSSIGKNAIIHGQVKLASDKNRPIHIGENVIIMQGVIISTSQKGKIYIGNDVYIGEYTVITSNEEIIIQDNVMIAPHNNIVDFDHKFSNLGNITSKSSFVAEKIIIKKGAWVASSCCVLKGTTIGEKAIIGAGSVVTKDVPACSVAVGNPASVIKRLD
jgi:acetyltransferase-like isoleucine patch superfamily enzyme